MKILVAVDRSEFFPKVINKAIKIALQENASILALHVIDTSFLSHCLDFSHKILENFKVSAKNIENDIQNYMDNNLDYSILIEEGNTPSDVIVQCAEINSADLIVIGYKGESAIERHLLGNVAHKVVSYAPCSVLIVKN